MNFQPQLTQLVKMCNGDKGAVKRLIGHAIERNPGRSPQWVIDKVTRDLERDRR